MTKLEAFNLAKAEIDSFGYKVRRVCLELPKKPPKGTFYSFFENPVTGEMLCRTYMYGKSERTVSFVEVLNPTCLRLQNPTLVENFLANGDFIYRDTPVIRKLDPKVDENGIISLYQQRILAVPG